MNVSKTNQKRGDPKGQSNTLIATAFSQLRCDILDGYWAPGEKLRVEHLKGRYGVSSGTLREALALLVSEDLVVLQGQRGFRVAPMSQADLEDLTRLRILIEGEALRESMAHGKDDWEVAIVSAFHKLTLAEQRLATNPKDAFAYWEKCNRQFHESLLSACKSTRLLRFQHILYFQAERYRRVSAIRDPFSFKVHEEHQAICDSVLARKTEEAISLLTSHVKRSLAVTRKVGYSLVGDQRKEALDLIEPGAVGRDEIACASEADWPARP